MELPGSTYLFNLSMVAMTFAAVSALVMIIRQTVGGKLSDFDIFLMVSFVSMGCVLSVDAMLPPLISIFEPPPGALWATASGLAAASLAIWVLIAYQLRRRVSAAPIPLWVMTIYVLHLADALLLAANSVVPALQDLRLYALALTLSLVVFMFSIVRRIASLFRDKRGEDWDPQHG
jgi:hypothetical protein